MLFIKDLLSQQDVDGIGSSGSGSRHHGDDGVLLDVERARVELEDVSEDGECVVGHNTGPEATDAAVQH